MAIHLTREGLECLLPRIARRAASDERTAAILSVNNLIADPRTVERAIAASALTCDHEEITVRPQGANARIPFVLAKVICDAIADELGEAVKTTMKA